MTLKKTQWEQTGYNIYNLPIYTIETIKVDKDLVIMDIFLNIVFTKKSD